MGVALVVVVVGGVSSRQENPPRPVDLEAEHTSRSSSSSLDHRFGHESRWLHVRLCACA